MKLEGKDQREQELTCQRPEKVFFGRLNTIGEG
jgi:hypothetical protein